MFSNPSIYDISDKLFRIVSKAELKNSQKNNKFQDNGTGTKIKIMPLGNSITEGLGEIQGGTPILPADAVGYRAELWHKLYTAGYYFTFVGTQNNGISSYGERILTIVMKDMGEWKLDRLLITATQLC